MDLTISHPVGRWQIDEIAFIPQQAAAADLHLQLRLHHRLHLHQRLPLQSAASPESATSACAGSVISGCGLHPRPGLNDLMLARFPRGSGYSSKRSSESRQI